MKKIIIELLILASAPFIVIFGSMLISYFPVRDDVKMVASIMAFLSLLFNICIAAAMIIKGHQENKTFNGW